MFGVEIEAESKLPKPQGRCEGARIAVFGGWCWALHGTWPPGQHSPFPAGGGGRCLALLLGRGGPWESLKTGQKASLLPLGQFEGEGLAPSFVERLSAGFGVGGTGIGL